jgi:Domain of unknown function (DUF4340)
MNFRITTFLFALLLATLWIFGLMIAHRKAAGDRSFVVPTLHKEDIKIDKVIVKHKEGNKELEFTFENIGDRWFLIVGTEKVRVEGFRIDGIIRQIKDARHDETANVEKARVDDPDVVVTLAGKAQEEPKEWKFYVGKENHGNLFVKSSDDETKVFAVPKRSLENLLFGNPNNFRSKRLFDFDDTGAIGVIIKKGDKELEVKRGDNLAWNFVTPKLGPVGFGDEPTPEPKNPHDPKAMPPKATSGVKVLLNDIRNVRVEDDNDFEPLGAAIAQFGLEKGKESMKIEVISAEKGEKKETTETLFIGLQNKQRKDGTFYYARMADDDGIFQINAKWLEPLDKAVNDPGKIRSIDISNFDEAKVDAVTLSVGKEEYQFFKTESKEKNPLPFPMPGQKKTWEMIIGKDSKKANDDAVRNLLDQVLGKKAIVDFIDLAPDADAKKKDAELGFDAPAAVIAVYANAIEKEKKDDAKDEKDKKEDKDKKDDKDAKKDEKDKKDALPTLKKDAKALVKLEFGKIDKENINVKRTLEDGTVSRFTVKKELFEKIVPSEGVSLAYLDTDLPEFPADAVVSLKLERKTDKGMETIELERRSSEGHTLWYVKDPLEPTGLKLADTSMVDQLVESMAKMHAKKWLKQVGEKEDLEKFGLKSPAAVISVTVKKAPFSGGATEKEKALPSVAAAATVALLANSVDPHLLAASFVVGSHQADKGEVVSVTLGKDTDVEKDKPGTFALHSGSKVLFLLPNQLVKFAKDTDFRDRAVLMHVQGRMIASHLGIAASQPIGLLMLDSPHISGQIFNLDPDKIKEIKLEVRTPFELRTFGFQRDPKDKSWTDKSNIPEFRLDSDKVTQFVKDIAKLKADRFVAVVGGPRGEHKLGAKQATVKLDFTLDDGKIVTLLVGTNFKNEGFYATTSIWPEVVFMIPSAAIEPMLKGAAQFAQERIGAN